MSGDLDTSWLEDAPKERVEKNSLNEIKKKYPVKKTPATKIKTIIVKDSRLELTEANIIKFIKEQEKSKVYEMKIRFMDNSAYEIRKLIDSLKKKGTIAMNKNGWIYLKKRERAE